MPDYHSAFGGEFIPGGASPRNSTARRLVALDALLLAHRAARANDPEGTAVGSSAVALLFAALGREQLAMRYVSRALQAADRYGDPLTLALARQGGAVVALAQGGWDDVRMLAEPAMQSLSLCPGWV